MNRLQQLFAGNKKDLLSIYYTAGYPTLDTTLDIAEALEKAGVDFLEIGFPISDPVADGPTIQHSSEQALEKGMTLNLLFEQLKDLRKRITIPILLMGYVNPIVQYGVEKFCKKAAEVGVDGIIVPDLPMYEYETLYANHFKDNNLSNIFLVTPQTSEERIRKIDQLSNSFIYLLSSSSITGGNLQVSVNKSFTMACEYASGAIVGSAFVKLLGTDGYLDEIPGFVKSIRV